MAEPTNPPRLLTYLFGQAAPVALATASPRLLDWSRAFDRWIAARRETCTRDTVRSSLNAWKNFLAYCPQPPWQVKPDDIRGYIAHLQSQNLAAGTIRARITPLSSFYSWCQAQRIDPHCPPGFNPAAGVRRPPQAPWSGRKTLSLAEVQALLGLLRRDESPLGKRDYAFFLARLSLGPSGKQLRRLKWGQIESQDTAGGMSVRWRPEAGPAPLPDLVWQAIRDYLQSSGRLATIRAQDHVFAPLVDPMHAPSGERAEDWDPERAIASWLVHRYLKRCGQLAGIPNELLTLPILRHTAASLRLEAGDDLEGLRRFLDTQARDENLKQYQRCLPDVKRDEPALSQAALDAIPLPDRMGDVRVLGHNLVHGYYARQQPPQAVAEVMAARIRGVHEELEGLRSLGRGLLELMERAATPSEAAGLGRAYAQAAARLGEMLRLEKDLPKDGEFSDLDRFLAWLDHVFFNEWRVPPPSAAFREELFRLGGGAELAGRDLKEEIAALRVVLRRTYRLALESRDGREYTHLADLYGLTCTRLMRLLKLDLGKGDVLQKGLDEAVKIAVETVCEEDALGIRYDDDEGWEPSEWAKANFDAAAKAGEDSPLMDQWLAESSQYWEDF